MKLNQAKNMVVSFFAFLSLAFLAQCGEASKKGKSVSSQLGGLVEIPVSLLQGDSAGLFLAGGNEGREGLQLTDASSFVMKLSGCRSGLSGTITTETFKIYEGDRDCKVKLESFVFAGSTYIPKQGFNFSTWLASDLSTFVNVSNDSDEFFVKVTSQLTQEQAQSDDSIGYSFYQAVQGEQENIAQATVSQANNIAVSGYESPNYVLSTNGSPPSTGTLAPVEFYGVDENGSGLFEFNLYCARQMDGERCGLTANDEGAVAYNEIEYKLIKDTYDLYTGEGELTIDQLDEIMSSGTSTIDGDEDPLRDNNKGFKTQTLAGPGPVHATPNMVLILSNTASYTYFSVVLDSLENE